MAHDQTEVPIEYVLLELDQHPGDPKVVLEAVKQDGDNLRRASEELRGNPKFVLEAVKQNASALQHASEELRSDREFVLAAVKQNASALQHAREELRSDREFVLEAVKQNGRALQHAPEEYRGDREFVLEAVKQTVNVLQHAPKEVRDDRDVVLAAVKQDGSALKHASVKLRGDRAIVLAAVKQNGCAVHHAPEEYRSYREIVLAKQNGYALQYASKELRGDGAIVLAAVKQDGTALKHASDKLRGNRAIVLAAVKQNRAALLYASVELRGDRKFVLEAVKQNGFALQYASVNLDRDAEIVTSALQSSPALLVTPWFQQRMGGNPEVQAYSKNIKGIPLSAQKDGRKKESENWRGVAQTLLLLNIANLGIGLQTDDDADQAIQVALIATALLGMATSLIFITGRMMYETLLELGSDVNITRTSTADVLRYTPREMVPGALVCTEIAMVLRGSLSVRGFDDDSLQYWLIGVTTLLVLIVNLTIWRCYMLFKKAKTLILAAHNAANAGQDQPIASNVNDASNAGGLGVASASSRILSATPSFGAVTVGDTQQTDAAHRNRASATSVVAAWNGPTRPSHIRALGQPTPRVRGDRPASHNDSRRAASQDSPNAPKGTSSAVLDAPPLNDVGNTVGDSQAVDAGESDNTAGAAAADPTLPLTSVQVAGQQHVQPANQSPPHDPDPDGVVYPAVEISFTGDADAAAAGSTLGDGTRSRASADMGNESQMEEPDVSAATSTTVTQPTPKPDPDSAA